MKNNNNSCCLVIAQWEAGLPLSMLQTLPLDCPEGGRTPFTGEETESLKSCLSGGFTAEPDLNPSDPDSPAPVTPATTWQGAALAFRR